MKLKKILSVCLALTVAFGLPSQSYQAFAAQLGTEKTGESIEILPSVPVDLNLSNSQATLPNDSEIPVDWNIEGAVSPDVSVKQVQLGVIPSNSKSKLLKPENAPSPVKSSKVSGVTRIVSHIARLPTRLGSLQSSSVAQSIGKLSQVYDGAANRPSGKTPSFARVGIVGRVSRFTRSGLRKAGALGAAVGVGAVSAVPAYAQTLQGISSLHAGLPSISTVLGIIATQGAYWVSMGLGFVMALPEFYHLIKKGEYSWRTYGVIVANFTVGIVVAPTQSAADKFLWGGEAISMSLVLVAGILISKFFHKQKGEADKNLDNHPNLSGSIIQRWLGAIRSDPAMRTTLALAPLLIAAGFGIYFSFAAFLPMWIAAVSPIKVSLINAVIQTVAQGFYLSLFIPDLADIRAGRRPKSFSPGFVLTFCMVAACFFLWSGGRALSNPAEHVDLILLAVSNVFQFLFSLITYRALRRPITDAGINPPDSDRLTQTSLDYAFA